MKTDYLGLVTSSILRAIFHSALSFIYDLFFKNGTLKVNCQVNYNYGGFRIYIKA